MAIARTTSSFLGSNHKNIKSTSGYEVVDINGNKYIDYTMELISYTFVNNNYGIQDTVINQLKDLTIYFLTNFLDETCKNV